MNIIQTRNDTKFNKDSKKINFIDAMLNPNADFGGLFTFDRINSFDNINEIYKLNYEKMACEIFKQLNLNTRFLDYALESYRQFKCYDEFKNPTAFREIDKNLYVLELYHGKTFAFKDMALAPFARLFSRVVEKDKKGNFLILSATSGDTGPATLEAFKNQKNIKVICIYPNKGTSDVQKLQMITQNSTNVKVYAINGDFDKAQLTLKNMLKDNDFRNKLKSKGFSVSVANSINLARIVFQIIYYFEIGKKLHNKYGLFDIVIPSGNFGNALGAFFAKQLGVTIRKIHIATNPNDILSEFINTGIYDIRDKTLKKSNSPAMDILKSSNIERILFFYFGANRTFELMNSLEKTNYFEISKNELNKIQEVFTAKSFSDNDCVDGIRNSFKNNYLLDPHTSNAYLYAQLLKQDKIPIVIISTAHFAKFANVMLKSLKQNEVFINDKDALQKLQSLTKHKIDDEIWNLFEKEIIHNQVYESEEVAKDILDWI